MKTIIIFPTWIIMKISLPLLPKNHMFKNKKITLKDWKENGTPINYTLSLAL